MATEKTTNTTKPIDFNAIKNLIITETRAVDKLIINKLDSNVLLINQMGHYIVNSGGKRLRPMLLLLVAKAMGKINANHLLLAVVIEFIHTATLLHDDVVDESYLRRGKESANSVWGNAESILVGDYLYSRAFEMMVCTDNMLVMGILSQTTTTIAEGEVLQLLNCNNPKTSEAQYIEVITRKTAALFSVATRLGGVLIDSNKETIKALDIYGLQLGIAFQLIDDTLDFKSKTSDFGKNLGDDLTKGKPTLPLIYAMEHGSKSESKTIVDAIIHGSKDEFDAVYSIVTSTKAIEYTKNHADIAIQKAINALDFLPESVYKDALIALAKFSVERDF